MSTFTEKSLIEDYLVGKLVEAGWKLVAAADLERESFEEPLLPNNLIRAVNRLNPGIGGWEIKQAITELKLKGSGPEGGKQVLNFFKFGVPVKFEKERVVKYVRLFDYEHLENNEFIVSRQVSYLGGGGGGGGDKTIRADIMLYVNGIPLVIIECKNPASFSQNWYDAYKQIKNYEKTVPELFKYVQLGVAAGQLAKYFPIVPWQEEEVKIGEWKSEGKDSIDSTIELLSRPVLLDVVRNFMFFRVEMGNTTKVITRYMQYRAANKIVERVLGNLEGKEDKNKGLIWHWQGSGKTLTMIFAANKLYHEKMLGNPTVFFIVDRIELEEQLYQEFYSLDMVAPEIIGSIDELRRVLEHDDGKGKRGIMITLIHKFRPEELSGLQKELSKIAGETITTRRNVIAFIDEGHRTQYGTMAAQMKSLLKGAFFFALTGTPISKRGRDTYLEFSYPPGEAYLDKYFITDSIKDGFTVKLVYQPRLEKTVHLNKDMLDAFLEVEFEELPEEIKERVEEKVKQKLNAINVFLENPNRIGLIAKDIAEHFRENIDGKFKAMIVAGSRKACVHYKRALDKLLPEGCSEIVMTYNRDDKEPIRDYLKGLLERHGGGKEIGDINKEIVNKFKEEEESPKILIVTDMLLTGFDAPILQTMYLDKPLKEHRLLQAIARTNRPFRGVKEAGLILDYVGILTEFKRAFELYNKEELKGALSDVGDMRSKFGLLLNELLGLFEGVPKNEYDRKTLLKAVEVLTADEARGEEFLENYKRLRKVFEFLGPNDVKLERFEDYKWISAIYTYYLRIVLRSDGPSYEGCVQKYFEKTLKFVHKTVELEKLEKDLPVISFDANHMEKLQEEKTAGIEEKAANKVFALNRLVLVEKHNNPVYESLTEKVERLLALWKEKTKDFERIYREGSDVISEINKLKTRQKELGFSDLEYAILLALEKKFGGNKEEILKKDVGELYETLKKEMFANWVFQQTARKNVERQIRAFLRKYKARYGMTYDEMDALYSQVKEKVETYGKAIRIHDSNVNFDVVHRSIKYPRLEFKTGELLLVLPKNCDDEKIIENHKDWIYKKNSQIQSALKEAKGKRLDLSRTDEEFRDLTISLVKGTSDELKTSINTIYFRKMKSKWGSCSSKKNLTINTLMKHLPETLIRYVIFHEMVHLIERKHNERFWKFIGNRFENYEENEKNLLVYWFLMQKPDAYSTYFSPQ